MKVVTSDFGDGAGSSNAFEKMSPLSDRSRDSIAINAFAKADSGDVGITFSSGLEMRNGVDSKIEERVSFAIVFRWTFIFSMLLWLLQCGCEGCSEVVKL